jgi:ketosteroid isomerase-like protein
MNREEQEVEMANESFYRAFESRDVTEMEKVWATGDNIQCGHPGWRILRGWNAVMESWRCIFEDTPTIRFNLTDVSIEICGALAWVTLYENLTSSVEGQNVSATILTTNIFEKSSGGWRMIHHHGSAVMQPPPDEGTPVVH